MTLIRNESSNHAAKTSPSKEDVFRASASSIFKPQRYFFVGMFSFFFNLSYIVSLQDISDDLLTFRNKNKKKTKKKRSNFELKIHIKQDKQRRTYLQPHLLKVCIR